MRNQDVVIFVTNKSGWTQTYHKKGRRWIQTSPPDGRVNKLTCEQFLSRLLPMMVEGNGANIRVEPLTKMGDEMKNGEAEGGEQNW